MGLSSKSVSTDDFFKKNLIKNLAALFGIDSSRIRVMEVVSARGARKRRSTGLSYIEVISLIHFLLILTTDLC